MNNRESKDREKERRREVERRKQLDKEWREDKSTRYKKDKWSWVRKQNDTRQESVKE